MKASQKRSARIRIYSGAKYRNADKAETGVVCAVEGLTKTYAGQGFGFEQDSAKPLLEPVLTYRVEPVCGFGYAHSAVVFPCA